ncbi:MAG: subclass B3 metallo-beta-lactamase [Steroidobacteraceae bacterium]
MNYASIRADAANWRFQGLAMSRYLRTLFVSLCLCLTSLQAKATDHPDWTTPLSPFQIADNLYYVGSRDLAAYLITTAAGNILINANLASSPPLIRASVEKLGFSWKGTKILLNSHAHSDHIGGAAEMLKDTSARDMVMEGDVDVVRSGGRNDFAFGTDGIETFPPARVDRVLHDGDTVVLGGVTLTAHRTGGHTRGCTAWTFRTHISSNPAGRLRNVVIVGGWRSLSQYRLFDTTGLPGSYPGIKEDFHKTFATLRALPCDIFLGAHGIYFDLLPKLKRMQTEGEAAFIDPKGYVQAVNEAQANFDKTVSAQTRKT